MYFTMWYFWQFQFQTGSIRRDTEKSTSNESEKFQFQTGSIRSIYILHTDRPNMFQFQTGSIKSQDAFRIFLEVAFEVSIPNWFD